MRVAARASMPWWSVSAHEENVAIVWIAIVLGLLLALAMWRGKRTLSAEKELKRRYARGEIDEPTYMHMLKKLRRRGA